MSSRASVSAWRFAAALLSAAVLAGCGFRLAGFEPMPEAMATTYIQAPDRRGLLPKLVADALENSGVTVAERPGEGVALLNIINDDTGQRVLSVTTRGGPEEIEVVHQVRYEVVAADRAIVAPTTLTLTRNYAYDRNDVLGTQQEGENVQAALAAEMATLIVRSIALSQ